MQARIVRDLTFGRWPGHLQIGWLLTLLVAATAIGCRQGWPFQSAQSPPPAEGTAADRQTADSKQASEKPALEVARNGTSAAVPAGAQGMVQAAYSETSGGNGLVVKLPQDSLVEKLPADSDAPALLDKATEAAAIAARPEQLPPPDSLQTAASPSKPTVTSYPAALASDAWVLAAILPNAKAADLQYTWRHAGLEPIFAQRPGQRAVLTSLLNDASSVVAANAAIVIARWGGAESVPAVPRLVATVRQTELKMPLRGAAAEALMTVPTKAALGPTRQLIDDLGDATGPQKASFTPQLHAALLKTLVRHMPAESDLRFATALKSPAAEVRLEAIRAYRVSLAMHAQQSHLTPPLPKAAILLCEDGDPRIRIAALGTVAAYREPDAAEAIKRALDDYELPVRLAAIAALGELGGDESRSALEKLSKHPSELKRAAVVSSLAAMGAHDAVMEAAKDKSSHVRQAVAQALAKLPQGAKQLKRQTDQLARDLQGTKQLQPQAGELASAPSDAKQVQRQTSALARDLLHDVSGDVQRRAVLAISEWPLEDAGPVLLTAIAEGGYMARREAADHLADLWPPAAGFPVSASAEKRSAALAELKATWIAQFGTLDGASLNTSIAKAEERLGIAAERIRELERLLAPLADASFPPQARRQAIEAIKVFGPDLLLALEQLSADGQQPLPLEIYRDVLPELSPVFAALDQLSSSKVHERRTAAETLVKQASGRQLSPLAVCRLAQVLVSEQDPSVWQSALAATANDPSADALQIARMAIGNPTVEVRRRACEYLSIHGSIDNTPLLLPLLSDPNTAIVIAAVRALAASGTIDDSAPLVQLLASPDKHVRVEVAITLGKLRCSEGVPALERLSHEGEWQIRQRAVTALGDCGDEGTVPLLMEMLDDRIEVQLAAMRSLVKITGHDAGHLAGGSPTSAEQARMWQRWYREQSSSAAEVRVRYDEEASGAATTER